jgi:cytochrome b6-f complex iron-sulfur subunit
MRWLLRLYPRAWRERYGEELLALIEETGLSVGAAVDLLRAAVDARRQPQLPLLTPSPAAGVMAMSSERLARVQPAARQLNGRGERRVTLSRRTFLRNSVLGSLAVVGLQLAGGAVAYAWPLKTSRFGSKIPVPRSAIPPVGGAPLRVLDGRFLLINNNDGLLALYWKCPHLGCTIPWAPATGQFECPCHGSKYDRHGVLIEGPAPRPMDYMLIETDLAGNLIVDTGAIQERETFRPEQATHL